MTLLSKKLTVGLVGAAFVAMAGTSAFAETYEVKMYTKHPENKKLKNVFVPPILKIKPGDTVKFISVDKSHNTESIKKMIPEGADKWKSKINKDFEITFDVEGAYGYKCTPHYALGMVGLVLVGDYSSNLEEIKGLKMPKKARKVFAELFEQAAQ